MVGVVAKKNTDIWAVNYFVEVKWAKVRPTGAPEGTEESVIWRLFEQDFKWGCALNDRRRKTIYEIGGSDESIIPYCCGIDVFAISVRLVSTMWQWRRSIDPFCSWMCGQDRWWMMSELRRCAFKAWNSPPKSV